MKPQLEFIDDPTLWQASLARCAELRMCRSVSTTEPKAWPLMSTSQAPNPQELRRDVECVGSTLTSAGFGR